MLTLMRDLAAAMVRGYRCSSCRHSFLSGTIEVKCPKCGSCLVDEVGSFGS